ncbi:methyltransferase domain-containing protein [Tundrisphaera lichenicola]|uniref:methyltransferase domain-containing protein n=1 Tax=Tundrisphaera lichenicola TaxID=2029860 RepID=UPI003EB8E227
MMATADRSTADWTSDLDLWRCTSCNGSLRPSAEAPGLTCDSCRRAYPILDEVLVTKSEVSDNNKIASDFYNSALWPKFRFWEWFTFICNGGEKRSRDKVLRHLPQQPNLKLLDVAIGDGVYLDWLPSDWSVVGIDVSTSQLEACRKRAGDRDLKLILGEAEDLPVRDDRFDAALSIGGFNYFNDPEKALREMVRAVRPGGTVVVSDEIPNLTDRMLFRKLGLPGVDRWIVSKALKLGDDFTDMVERYRTLDVRAIAERVLPGSRYEKIWMGVGYVLVGRVPD